MGAALLACRLVLLGVFLTAGIAKLVDRTGSREAAVGFGVPEGFAGVVGDLLPLAEIAVAVALVPVASARFGAIGALVLLVSFSVAITNALAHGRAPDCHCFGQVHSAPAGPLTLARNAVLLALAGFVAIGGWGNGGDSATAWVTRVGAGWVVAIGLGVVMIALVCFQVWFSLQLLAQNGRTLRRIESLEGLFQGLVDARGGAVDRPQPGAGLTGGGLAVGSRAPEFELDGVDGNRHSLSSLLSPGRELMLVFSDAGCGPCDALLPDLAGWQREFGQLFTLAIVAGGDANRNRKKTSRHGLARVLLQSERQVSDAYQAFGTPSAVVVAADGVIRSPVVGGAEAIGHLVTQMTQYALAVIQAPASNGHHNGNGSPPSGERSRVGQPAPELTLRDLDGNRVALAEVYGDRAVAIFWNPDCGFCQRMLPELRAFEEHPPEGAPRLLVISAGDRDRIGQDGIRSTLLLDPDSTAMGAFDARGTPMGVLIAEGRIASPVAAGADAVFELIRSAGAGSAP